MVTVRPCHFVGSLLVSIRRPGAQDLDGRVIVTAATTAPTGNYSTYYL